MKRWRITIHEGEDIEVTGESFTIFQMDDNDNLRVTHKDAHGDVILVVNHKYWKSIQLVDHEGTKWTGV